MKIAIYSRKSKITEYGESISNQIDMCMEYANMHFKDCEFDIYEDEGFSGGNIDRPRFKRLLQDIADKKVDVLICYRLDRISRNVADFSETLELLNQKNVSFISIKEQFDTTTPMGRAMMYIASVFAQLERDTIAERIKDNMRRLARTGRYLGSTPPFGFKSEKIEYLDSNGNKKKMHQLYPVAEDMKFVKLIYNKYHELSSLSKVETYLMKEGYRNKNGNFTGITELRRLLTNPVYVKASKAIFEYYTSLRVEVVNPESDFNGKHGMLIYGRHDRDNGAYNPEKWTVVIANHEGVIDSELWLEVQNTLEHNKSKAPRAGTSRAALLTSKIRCAECGGTMVIIYGANKNIHYYKCRNKIKSRKSVCNMKNVNGKTADEQIFTLLKELADSPNTLNDVVRCQKGKNSVNEAQILSERDMLTKTIVEKHNEIKNLTAQLRDFNSSSAAKYIISDIENLDKELAVLENKLNLMQEQLIELDKEKFHTAKLVSDIKSLGRLSTASSVEEKHHYIDKIINEIIWDGREFSIQFR